jgi:anti-sigma factor RsiW
MTRRIPSRACDRARAHISAQLDGELSEFEHARLTLHLAGCPACRAYEADVATVTGLVRAAPLEPLEFPISLPGRRRSGFRQFELAAAVALAVAIGVGSMFSALSTSRSSALFGSAQAPRPAYLDSPDYDLHVIQQVRSAQERLRTGSATPL